MGRTNVVVDDVLVERVKRIYGVRTTREAIQLALRNLVGDLSDDPHAGLLELEGTGWTGDLDEMRHPDPALESWLRAE
jgi:Arc/MetJ family transcription regulator